MARIEPVYHASVCAHCISSEERYKDGFSRSPSLLRVLQTPKRVGHTRVTVGLQAAVSVSPSRITTRHIEI
ncbi:hypothetical protein BAUCODRAFT_32344 [Baudoinia panamericana UAMH 10762]|uniref:Uncharacterized protein n=1 Tax=Baudoinia panamericana (strain UAMH 10762) TaxID=717646 RepID=M2NH27_BAUPA|nr:uncharacterized protein BAUCODRAFT_32344 [Baudoinia panamericana UAMH 10762]EMC98325.1 hypothetical protein BAUCODRAFT_32344 [Baudoinia panamericana UAMH 10762]